MPPLDCKKTDFNLKNLENDFNFLIKCDFLKSGTLTLVNWCFNRESKTYLCTSDKTGFLATRSMTRINVDLALSYVKLLLSSWKIYMCNLKAWFINK